MNPLNNRRVLSSILAAVLATALLALAVAAADQTASGTIGSVGAGSFTLETDAGTTLEFVTDANTVVDGELKSGARASVTYRIEDGKNIAIRVQVAS